MASNKSIEYVVTPPWSGGHVTILSITTKRVLSVVTPPWSGGHVTKVGSQDLDFWGIVVTPPWSGGHVTFSGDKRTENVLKSRNSSLIGRSCNYHSGHGQLCMCLCRNSSLIGRSCNESDHKLLISGKNCRNSSLIGRSCNEKKLYGVVKLSRKVVTPPWSGGHVTQQS